MEELGNPMPNTLVHSFPKLALSLRTPLVGVAFAWVGSLFVALLAQIRFPLPFTPVPITGQTLAVMLVGAALGSRLGALSLGLYLLQGLIGFPFFQGGNSGMSYVFGATGGYLAGFVLAAAMIGWAAERGWDRRFRTALPVFLVGQGVVLACGWAWLSTSLGMEQAWAAGVLPFLADALVKLVLAAGMMPAAWMVRERL
jgi:biotin transport system substrate-specific component